MPLSRDGPSATRPHQPNVPILNGRTGGIGFHHPGRSPAGVSPFPRVILGRICPRRNRAPRTIRRPHRLVVDALTIRCSRNAVVLHAGSAFPD